MSKALLYAMLIFFITQSAVWFQTNGQFISSWCKNNPFILSLFGITPKVIVSLLLAVLLVLIQAFWK